MALILRDRVKETTTVTSTGTATLLGAAVGYQSFSVIGTGNTCYYTIASQTANEWEVGLGTFTSPDQLSRDTVLESSNSGSLVNFSAGTKDVFVTQPAEKAVYADASNIINAFGNGSNTITFAQVNTTNLVANTVTLTAGTISTNAANATDITNKTYVDALFSTGITYHAPVLVESPTALTATYNQPGGAGNGVGATLTNSGANVALSIDGVSLSNTARVLVYTQSNAVQNGVYTVTNPGNVSAQWVLTRATDADTYGVGDPNKLGQGDAFFVQSGNTGAGETYILNTVGTITFGTTNLTFAQISSAQVYSAGTGLNLTNLAFSIANTAVTAAQYGNDGAVGQFTVNAQGQITNAANVSINASSISVGTLANGRTTAASANGASTIVLRDSNGSFAGNVITATTSNATTFNGTTGSFTNVSGNGVALTAINASNVTSGTLANARTTASDANSASTIVARDANGSFGANIITATFSGNGASISAINASNISSGTIANARTTASSSNGASTIVQRDSGGNFSANTVTAAVIGDLSGGSNINASNIASGTIANARTTASSSNGASTIVLRGASGEFAAGAITGTSFSGNGSALTAINATAITTGTIDNARTTAASANGASTIVARDANGSFSGNVITGTTGTFTNISGNGTSLTAINASNISSGTIANARTTAATANGASTIVLRGTSGEFSAGAITGASFTGDGAAISAINASNVTSGTIANARTTGATANGASTLVLRDANGSFAGNVITGTTGTFTSVSGNGVALTAINASNISSGTIANARTTASDANGASTIVSRDANGSFTANVGTFTSISGNGVSLTAINASNITSGTIANARTTAASANGASTIIARDANGSFAANVVSAATGSFTAVSGNGVALTAINASNIASGTIANARTTASDANGASTIVARDANGSFSANIITANGSAISAINGSNVTTGTVANARTTASDANGASTIVSRSAAGSFAGNVGTFNGVTVGTTNSSFDTDVLFVDATNNRVGIGTSSPAYKLDISGTNPRIRLNETTGFVLTSYVNTGGTFDVGRDSSAGAVAGTAYAGFLDLSGAYPIVFRTNSTERMRIFSSGGVSIGNTTDPGAGNLSVGGLTGAQATPSSITMDGSFSSPAAWNALKFYLYRDASDSYGITVGNISDTQYWAGGASTGVHRWFTSRTERMRIYATGGVSIGNTTDPGATNLSVTGTIAGNGAPLTAINASNISSGTIANARTTAASANGASTIVARDANGSFAGNVVTATTGTFTSVSGNGVALTAINASNIASGTIANARTTAATANGASTIVLRGTSGEFSAGAITSVSISGNGIALTAINASNIASGTLANARTTAASANGASTIVTRDASGNFTSNEITANVQIVENGIYVNKKTIAANYTIATDYNGLSAGPVTVANSVTVTVSTGSTWVVV